MVPLQSFGRMPARIIEHKTEPFSFLLWNLFGHRVEKGLKDLGVTMRDDEAHQLTSGRAHRSNDILANVTTVVSLGWPTPSLNPPLSGTRVTFKAGFISKENLRVGIFQ